jgi:hypothetical protein
MRFHLVVSAALLIVSAVAARAADILTVDEVAQAGGLTGVHTVAKNALPGAGGELNFADDGNKLVAIVMLQPASMYATWKQRFGGNGEAVGGLGEEAFRTKPNALINYVVLRKGGNAVWVQSMGYKGAQQTFSAAQLTALAKLAAGRL